MRKFDLIKKIALELGFTPAQIANWNRKERKQVPKEHWLDFRDKAEEMGYMITKKQLERGWK